MSCSWPPNTSFWMRDTAAQRWSGRLWSGCATWLLEVDSTACTCIPRIGWRAAMPTRRCSWTNSTLPAWRSCFSIEPLANRQKMSCCCRSRAWWPNTSGPRFWNAVAGANATGPKTGVVSVLSGAPFGYRYIKKEEGGGAARFEIMLDEARVVRQVFQWVGQERATIGDVVRRLTAAKELTRTGRTVWDRTTVWDMLKNPAYVGLAAFGKTQAGPLGPRLRAQRGRSLQPRRARSHRDAPPEDWLHIPVPPLVDAVVFAAVQEQLEENRRRARQGLRGARYLLQGLVCCAQCGYAFYGKAISPSKRRGRPRSYAYYRCIGTDAYRFGGERVCHNHQIRTDLLDAAVWREACALLEQPNRLEQEYRQRLAPADEHAADHTTLELQRTKLRHGLTRLIDSYTEGFLEKQEFESRITRQRQRIAALDEQIRQFADAASTQRELRVLIGRLEDFAAQVENGLETADWPTRREIIRTLISRVEIDHTQVNVMFRVPPDPFVASPDRLDRGVLQHCRRGGWPPCGVPSSACVHVPILKHASLQPFLDEPMTRLSPILCSTNFTVHSCEMASKNPRMSASST